MYLYRQKPERNWLGLVIYPNRASEKSPSVEFAPFLSLQQIHRVYLEDYQHLNEPGYAMLKLIACPADETVQLAQTLANQHDKLSREMLEFIETVLVYKLPNLSREEIRIMLALNDVQLKQTRFYQEIAEEERREGKLEGKLEGETQLLIRLLNKRFGPLPAWAQQKIAHADLEQLGFWSERILDAKTLVEIFD